VAEFGTRQPLSVRFWVTQNVRLFEVGHFLLSIEVHMLLSYGASLATQLPLLIVYLVGLRLALSRRAEQPRAMRLALWAFTILLLEVLVGNLATNWLVAALNTAAVNSDSGALIALLNGIGVVRVLVHTLGVALLIRALFPPRPDAVAAPWVRWVVGGVIGLIVGAGLGLVLGDPLGEALDISTFEGARGYFVVLAVIPGFALVGALLGALTAGLTGRR
jgi:hypothetical protein